MVAVPNVLSLSAGVDDLNGCLRIAGNPRQAPNPLQVSSSWTNLDMSLLSSRSFRYPSIAGRCYSSACSASRNVGSREDVLVALQWGHAQCPDI